MNNKIIRNMPMSDYLACGGVSQSDLKLLDKSPQKYLSKKNNGNYEAATDAMNFGTAFHEYLLEPETFECNYFVHEKISKTSNKYRDMASEMYGNNIKLLSEADFEIIKAMKESIMSHKKAGLFLTPENKAELSLFWEDEDVLVKCKGKIDSLKSDNIIVDIKTARDATSKAFKQTIFKEKYNMQLAYYSDGYKAITGKEIEACVIIAIEKEPPYLTAVYGLEPISIDAGRHEYKKLLNQYKQFTETGVLDCGDTKIISVIPPQWYLNEIDYCQEVIS